MARQKHVWLNVQQRRRQKRLTLHICLIHGGQQEGRLPVAWGWGCSFPPGVQMGRGYLELRIQIKCEYKYTLAASQGSTDCHFVIFINDTSWSLLRIWREITLVNCMKISSVVPLLETSKPWICLKTCVSYLFSQSHDRHRQPAAGYHDSRGARWWWSEADTDLSVTLHTQIPRNHHRFEPKAIVACLDKVNNL